MSQLPVARGAARLRILAVLLVAFGIRLAFAFLASDEAFLTGDAEDYRDISANLVAGHGFSASTYRWYEPEPAGLSHERLLHPDLHRPPVLPLLGAGLLYLPGSWSVWARILTAVLGASAVWLLFVAARRLVGSRAAFWAALLFALHPYAIFYAARWLTEGPFVAALLLFLAALAPTSGRAPATPRTAFLGGAALGLAILTRPPAIGLVPLSLLWYWLRGRRAILRVGFAFLLGAAIVTGPWAARNYRHTGVPTPLTFVGPYNLWLGTNDWQYEVYRADTAGELKHAIDALYAEGANPHVRALEAAGVTDVVAVNRYWLARASEYARNEPEKMAFILGRRALHYVQPAPQRGATTEPLRVFSGSWMVLLYGLALAAFLTGSVRVHGPGRNTDGAFLLLLPLAGFLTAMPFIFSLRYRFPFFDPLVVLVAATAIPALLDRIASRFPARARADQQP